MRVWSRALTPRERNSPRYELDCVNRADDDFPAKGSVPRGGVIAPLAWVSLALVALIAFVWWLLVGPPLPT